MKVEDCYITPLTADGPTKFRADELRLQGMAVALAEIIRLHQSETEVADVLRGFGIGEQDLVAAGVQKEDLDALRPALEMQAY